MNQHRALPAADYDADFAAWTAQQSELLRALGRLRPDLPSGLDLGRIAEEIEDLGRSELNAARSLILQILIHVIKAASEPLSQAMPHWRAETMTLAVQLRFHYAPSMRRNIDLDDIWSSARGVAELKLLEHDGALAQSLLAACPLSLDELVSPAFNLDAPLQAAISRAESVRRS